jgi:hypothetical protein
MGEPVIQEYERHLDDVFEHEDPVLMSRAIRLCVLFEDLRVEYQGAIHRDDIRVLDEAGKNFRQFYFIRRSLVTMIEFSGALSRLNTVKGWQEELEQMDPGSRRIWNDAVTYFNEHHKRWEAIRGDIGGHFKEAAAEFSLNKLRHSSTGKLIIRSFPDEEKATPILEFTTEFVGIALRKTMAVDNPTEEQHRAFINETFTLLTAGWRHAVGAVFILVGEFLFQRYVSAPPVENSSA